MNNCEGYVFKWFPSCKMHIIVAFLHLGDFKSGWLIRVHTSKGRKTQARVSGFSLSVPTALDLILALSPLPACTQLSEFLSLLLPPL